MADFGWFNISFLGFLENTQQCKCDNFHDNLEIHKAKMMEFANQKSDQKVGSYHNFWWARGESDTSRT